MDVARFIDHTLLKPEATAEQVAALSKEAKEFGFASVCIQPSMVEAAYEILHDSDVKVCTVIGFPLGATLPEVKAFETKAVIENGAREVDMVINIGALKSGDDKLVKSDIEAVAEAAKDKALVKVIIETALLTDEEKQRACRIAVEAGADFVKTSTGFAGGGAAVEDVQLMKQTVGDKAKVKASGGVRDKETALKMIEAGAERIGTSSGTSIAAGETGSSEY
ncbi:deoxyribose-phosphate aldolase [Alteribacillus persepolensis]|uniref:Deoxyribose-phosphate aldolase n=1 Tax=Alteribacillus persepolensis TaxID=568899 RepID=A0A1G8CPR7_9BACI|nr:deoxyribose-phosphate aldolase [Alteribacillus persepolensis]SDH47475.1 deoxyribose-phosphate aldolase [Alteribacillus persepolensis]